MKKVLFITVYPSPYRVDFFTELGKTTDLTVYFLKRPDEIKHRSAEWFSDGCPGFRAVFPEKTVGRGRLTLHSDVKKTIGEGYDFIVVCGWSEPTFMYAISYMRRRKIPYIMEIDGGFISDDGPLKKLVKKHFISGASAWLGTGRVPTKYLVHYGADPERIFTYPFTSQREADVPALAGPGERREARRAAKERLGFEGPVALSVGQFIRRKGFDVLIRSAARVPGAKFVIVGGEAPEEYKALRESEGAENVSFAGFMKKDKLAEYYLAADVFVMPTREDIWGLVVNEALSFGLPVVSTDRCVAALELVKEGETGFIVPSDDPAALAEAVGKALSLDPDRVFKDAADSVKDYTVEKMAERHAGLFDTLGTLSK
ncbi:MAG: glycosyltransferase family 4 protein [Clostridia bacterium]|nr:glycosyltransferase family 4 protein [Clostridia bacterium]